MTFSAQHDAAESERARVRMLERHERAIMAREAARHMRRALAAGPSQYVVEDPEFKGCFWDAAPYPAPVHPVFEEAA